MTREPTEEMLNAARDWSAKKYGKPIGNDAAIGCWQAMFDAMPEDPCQTHDGEGMPIFDTKRRA